MIENVRYQIGFTVQGLLKFFDSEYTCQSVKITATGDLPHTCTWFLFNLYFTVSFHPQITGQASQTRKSNRKKSTMTVVHINAMLP